MWVIMGGGGDLCVQGHAVMHPRLTHEHDCPRCRRYGGIDQLNQRQDKLGIEEPYQVE
jgi:hypothetical protein